MKLLDTDTCIKILRGNSRVIEHRAADDQKVGPAWVTASELYYGAAKSPEPEHNRDLVAEFLSTLPLLGIDPVSAQLFGDFKATLERAGTHLADADLWIGAISVVHNAPLVTGNKKHFERIPGVRIEDWIRGERGE